MFAKVRGYRDLDPGGVIADIEWYREDPEEDFEAQPILIDQVMLYVPDTTHVTQQILDNAITKRQPEVERMTRPRKVVEAKLQTSARAVLGKVRPIHPVHGVVDRVAYQRLRQEEAMQAEIDRRDAAARKEAKRTEVEQRRAS